MRHTDPDNAWKDGTLDPFYRPDSVHTLREQLRRDYEGRKVAEVMPGRFVRNDYGRCYRMKGSTRGALVRCTRSRARQDLSHSLNLIHGIRDRTHARLTEQGYETLADLEAHPRYGGESRRLRQLVDRGSAAELVDVLADRMARSDPLVLTLAGFHRDSDFLFLDLETMGLFYGQPVVLAGIARPAPGNLIKYEQYLALDFEHEAALIAQVSRAASRARVLATYNGRSFDLPFLQARAAFYGIPFDFDGLHFDLLHFSRRAWRDRLPGCSLATVEREILGLSREDDLPGEHVPEFFQEFLRSGNPGFLKPIVDHNRQDIVSLVSIFSELTSEGLGPGD